MKKNKIFSIIFLVLALGGFADATYITANYSLGKIPPCFVTTGCETVLLSSWSKIAGIHVSVLGMVYYLCILALAAFYLYSKKEKVLALLAWGTFAGFIMSVWFVAVQAFIIGDFCFYCLISATTSTILFVVGSIWIFSRNKNQ